MGARFGPILGTGTGGGGGGLNQLTGDVIAGPGTGSQVATLEPTSNVESVVRASAPNQMAPHTANENFNGFNAINPGNGIVADQFATLQQLAGVQYAYVVSGCLWTADASGSTLLASMTSGTVMIKGILLTVAAVTSRAFVANDDTYVDFTDNGDGTAAITYSTVANNNYPPALAGTSPSDTIRNAAILAGATSLVSASICQGSPVPVTAGNTPASTTVAAGSNGNNITTATLAVAANSMAPAGLAVVDTTVGAGGNLGTLIRYTSGGGTTTLSGVSVLSGSGTVATGGAVAQVQEPSLSDVAGNLIYPTTPKPIMLMYKQKLNSFTTTSTAQIPINSIAGQFLIPAGPPRKVRMRVNWCYLQSSAAAGTAVDGVVGYNAPGGSFTALGGGQFKVSVTSDGASIVAEGNPVLLTPGTYVAIPQVLQGAAGTLTVGATGLWITCTVEYVD